MWIREVMTITWMTLTMTIAVSNRDNDENDSKVNNNNSNTKTVAADFHCLVIFRSSNIDGIIMLS